MPPGTTQCIHAREDLANAVDRERRLLIYLHKAADKLAELESQQPPDLNAIAELEAEVEDARKEWLKVKKVVADCRGRVQALCFGHSEEETRDYCSLLRARLKHAEGRRKFCSDKLQEESKRLADLKAHQPPDLQAITDQEKKVAEADRDLAAAQAAVDDIAAELEGLCDKF